MAQSPWWWGARGEWYVVAQFILLGLVLAAPWLLGRSTWPPPWGWLARIAGGLLLLLGLVLVALGWLALGHNLSPLPHPKDEAALVETGIYGLVRHPIYSGLIAGCFGWALLTNSLPT